MRADDDERKPRPVRRPIKKPNGAAEAAEAIPWSHLERDEREHHRHVA